MSKYNKSMQDIGFATHNKDTWFREHKISDVCKLGYAMAVNCDGGVFSVSVAINLSGKFDASDTFQEIGDAFETPMAAANFGMSWLRNGLRRFVNVVREV